MDQIDAKIRQARTRLLLGRLAKWLCWSLFAAWLIATLAIVARSIWVLPTAIPQWDWAWIGGSTIVAFVVAATLTWITSPPDLSVAAEIDERFGLKQRLGSVLAMSPSDRQSPLSQDLIDDAARRAGQLQLGERFPLAFSRLGWLPVLPMVLIAIAICFGPATRNIANSRPSAELIVQAEQVKKSTESLKKKIQQQRRKAEATGLKNAAELFAKLEADVDKLAERESAKPKETLIAINDIKKQLDDRRKQLAAPESMRESLSKMGEHERGPAEQVVKAMQEGDFAKAKEQAKALAEKLRSDKLTDAEKQALQKQIEKVKDQLKQTAEQHEAKKQDLQQKIEQAKQAGRSDEAAKMQQELNELQAQDGQMQQMQQMAESMQAAADAMAQGDAEQAGEALESIADQLGQMQDSMEELQDIQETLDTLSQSKDAMRCKSCSGHGCEQCQGSGNGEPGDKSGKGGSKYGLGKGSGLSGPEEKESDTQGYESQVRGDPKQGRGLNAGFADGPNKKGVTREGVKDAVLGAMNDDSDPLENQTLPRTEREHAQEYFDRLRSGN